MLKHCDTSTGKIYGCKKGSHAWWHEKGHLVFANSEKGSELGLIQSYALKFFFLFVFLALVSKLLFFSILSGIILLIYYGIDLIEELWCNSYADFKSYY